MSRDESSLPAVTDADEGPGGPGIPPHAADLTLRGQVLDLINDALTDPDPDGEWARSQLRRLLATYPEEPERVLREHLMETRRLGSLQDSLPAPVPAAGGEPLAGPVTPDPGITREIRSILGDRMLLTAFQPICELAGERITGFEALTRFVGSDGAGADTWFEEAEAVGLGPELEIAALRCALTAAREIPSVFSLAFNLSPATFTDPRVQDLLLQCGLAIDKIVIELRGRASNRQWNALLRALYPLRQRGLRVAVDGSGAGYTPAERILSLRPEIIKLDRTFIEAIFERSDPDEPAVIVLAREVGAVLAAEGIETAAELAAVIETGVTLGQGYLLGRPSVHPLEWSAWVLQAEAASGGTSRLA